MGTHPIFESDFDCLTDMEMDEDSFASIVGLKNDSIKEKIRKLRQKGDDLLQSIDNNLKPNIDRAELQQSEKKKTKILRLKNDLDADETISDIKSGIILKRKLNLETDISKMKKVLVLAEELDKFEQRLQKVPTSVVGKARMFCEMTDWLEKHESGGKLGKLRVVQSYTNRIKILNPINTLVNMWSEYVKFQKDSIELKPPVKEVVDGLVVLDRLEHYLDELFSSLATLIERNRCLVFKKNVLSLKETRDYKLGENVAAVCSFLVYVDELGFKLSGANLAKIESALVETFVRPTILAGAETSGEISNVLEAIQAMAREISVESPKQHAKRTAGLGLFSEWGGMSRERRITESSEHSASQCSLTRSFSDDAKRCGHLDLELPRDQRRRAQSLRSAVRRMLTRAVEGYNLVPNIRPLETLHNSLSLHQITDFAETIIKMDGLGTYATDTTTSATLSTFSTGGSLVDSATESTIQPESS